jgi:hypothetical protein
MKDENETTDLQDRTTTRRAETLSNEDNQDCKASPLKLNAKRERRLHYIQAAQTIPGSIGGD